MLTKGALQSISREGGKGRRREGAKELRNLVHCTGFYRILFPGHARIACRYSDQHIPLMPNEPTSITTMKRYYSDGLHVPDRPALMSELIEGNDRSLIITLASLAESMIETLIGRNLPALEDCTEKEFNYAFRHDGPLGTFSACIDMAFYLELIDSNTRDQLHDLRDMRNAVAHTRRRVTLEDYQLSNVARRLFKPKGMFELLDETHDGFRRTLVAEGLLICTTLTFGREKAIKMCRESYRKEGKPPPF
jgi:hypothetical protein